MVIIKTNHGDISIELDKVNTPNTTKNFLQYVNSGFYDGTIFHRVIDGFMIQGGGFDAKMQQKKTGTPIQHEAKVGNQNKRGTIAMARTNDPHSATAQFFINVVDNDFLDHKNQTPNGWGYCVFGRVVDGLDVVDKIKKVATSTQAGHQNVPTEPVVIESISVKE